MIEHCVLGVFETTRGLDIAGEMSTWIKDKYKLYKVTQESIEDNLYELPALLFASSLSIKLNVPVLYLHTKGAVNAAPVQNIVRLLWKKEFGESKNWYDEHIEGDKPKVLCPISTGEEVAWYNGFVMNPSAAKIINERIAVQDRYYYEQSLLKDSGIEVVGKYKAEKQQVTKKMFEVLGVKYTIRKPQ